MLRLAREVIDMADMSDRMVTILLAVVVGVTLVAEVQNQITANDLTNVSVFGSAVAAIAPLLPFFLVIVIVLFIRGRS